MEHTSEGTPFESDAETGLPIGPRTASEAATFPGSCVLTGRFGHLEPLSHAHDTDLFEAASGTDALARHRYLVDDVPKSVDEIADWRAHSDHGGTRVGWAVVDGESNEAQGRLFLMRIQPALRTIEIGNILFGPAMARTPMSTEAVYLLMRYIFEELGYRRFEWKCDALNAPSRRAAERYGFSFEGIFRRDMIVKSRTRDTAWFSIIEEEWPQVRAGFEGWLDPANFDAQGRQKNSLEEARRAASDH